jgi:dipeptidyl aminopeptidase/acylaminoacyl peptidase
MALPNSHLTSLSHPGGQPWPRRRPHPRLRTWIATGATALLVACAQTGPDRGEAGPYVTPPAALHVEGLPPLPEAVLVSSARYTDVSGHAFVDWHPQREEMLVAHRAPGASTTQLYRLSAPGAALEQLTDSADPVSVARWDPQGRFIVFQRGQGGNEAFQLFRLDAETRAATQLTPDGYRHAMLDWLRGSGEMLFSSVPLDRTAAAGRRDTIATTIRRIDPLRPDSARVVAELPGPGWFGGAVSPDGRQMALTRYQSATRAEVWLLDLADGQRRRLLPAPGEPLAAAWFAGEFSPDGRHLHVTSDSASEFRELMRLDLQTGALTRLTGDIPWDITQGDASQGRDAGRWIALAANVDGRDELRVFDAASGRELSLPDALPPPGRITGLAFHPAGGALAASVTSARGPSQIHVLRLADQGNLPLAASQRVQWTRPTVPEGLGLDQLPEQQVVRWTSFDGRTISGLLTMPPARFQGPRPVLMLVHGGPEAQARAGWLGRFNYLVNERGIAVLQPNVRGSTGYGKTFVSLDDGRLREDSVRDLGTGLDWIDAQPQLDGRRVVVMGGSYGGYMTLAASVHFADRIAGGISTVGISNFVSFLENTESYRRDLRRSEYGDERDPQMRAFLESISPLNHVERITQPLLVVQGRNDPRVPWTESEQIVRRLQARGVEVGYLLADNEGHGFARRENADYYFGAVVQFLDRTLLGR